MNNNAIRLTIDAGWRQLRTTEELRGFLTDLQPVIMDAFDDSPQQLRYAGDYLASMQFFTEWRAPDTPKISLGIVALVASELPPQPELGLTDVDAADAASLAVRSLMEMQFILPRISEDVS